MRNKFAEILSLKAKKNKKIIVVVADISPAGKMNEFQKKNSKRFINVGVSEQFMVGFSSGLAIAGLKPFIYTIAPFSVFRPFEMIRDDLCYQNLPVTIVGMGAGTIYSTLGGTHLSQEDISVLRGIPNIKILAPCDPLELEECLKFCINDNSGPTYLRIGKSGEKNITNYKTQKWKFGKIRQIINGEKLCILSFGPITEKAFKLSEDFQRKISVYSCHTLKPFDTVGLRRIFKKYKNIITLEDHSIIGGLSSIVKSEAFENKYKGNISTFSLKDKFIHNYGSHDDLLNSHGINSKLIRNKIKSLI